MIKQVHEMTLQELTLVLARDEQPEYPWRIYPAGVAYESVSGMKGFNLDWKTIGPIWERDRLTYKQSRLRYYHVTLHKSADESYLLTTEDVSSASATPESIARAIVAMRHPEGVEI